jgi:hypothetical protein
MMKLHNHTTARIELMTRSLENHRRISQDRLITLGYLAVLGGGATLGKRRSLLVCSLATVAYAVTVLATSQQPASAI